MKALFYSLHAAIWLHSLPESRLARQLSKDGNEVVYVSCGESFPIHCTSMSAVGINFDSPISQKMKVCRSCTKNAKMLSSAANSSHLQLNNFLNVHDYAIADNLVSTLTRDNYLDLIYLGVPVGRIATYEPFLKYKKMSTQLNDEQWLDYCIHLKNCIVSLIGFSRIYEHEKPDKLFLYSPQYGVNGVCAEYAIHFGSTVYFVEGSSSNSERYSALRVWNWAEHRLVNPALNNWSNVRDHITVEDVMRVKGHINELYKGTSFAVFSEPMQGKFSLREYFKIPKTSKVILASLSSFDEAYSAFVIGGFPERKVKSPVFKDQFEWIQRTIEFLRNKPDIYLIIRVHPRDYANKRDSYQSEQADVWETTLNNLPSNIVVNTPDQRISIYDVFNEVDLMITGWSATGVEALLHGIPVVTYDEYLPSYPNDIHFSGSAETEYFININKALSSNDPIQNSINAYRWLAVSFSMGTVRITGPLNIGKNWPDSIFFKIQKRLINKLFTKAFKFIDVRRGFGNEVDKKRFSSLINHKKNSLFEVIEKNDAKTLSDDKLKKLIFPGNNNS